MRPIALDTNTYIAFLRADPVAIRVVQRSDALQSARWSWGNCWRDLPVEPARNATAINWRSSCLAKNPCRSAHHRNRRCLRPDLPGPRQRGTPIPTNDLWIAASCLEHGTRLVSYDQHYAALEGLRWGQSLEAFLP